MFEDQNQKTEDIFSETDKQPAASPVASAPTPPLGPPSALAQGKLQVAQPGSLANSAVPMSQLSGATKSGFPFKKVLAISLISLFLVGGALGAFYWWRGRSQSNQAPSLGAPVKTEAPSTNQPAETGTGNEDGAAAAVGDKINETYSNLNQGAVNSALDPFAAPANPAAPADASGTIDTDQDGLSDAQEFTHGTNPRLVDSDGDGLSDWEEVSIFGTDPLKSDTDSDGFSDGEEVQNGYNPKGSGKLLDFEKAKSGINQ